MQTGLTTYAFVQYIDINGAMFAKRKMDREYIGHTIVKVPLIFIFADNFLPLIFTSDLHLYFLLMILIV